MEGECTLLYPRPRCAGSPPSLTFEGTLTVFFRSSTAENEITGERTSPVSRRALAKARDCEVRGPCGERESNQLHRSQKDEMQSHSREARWTTHVPGNRARTCSVRVLSQYLRLTRCATHVESWLIEGHGEGVRV